MNRKLSVVLVVTGFALLVAALPAIAHHAFAAEFDVNAPVQVTGKITKLDWTNPHAWLYVDVTGADGKVVNWRFELGAPNALIRLGWKKDAIAIGTDVNITGFRAKAGGPVANGRSIKMSDGKELFSGGSTPPEQ
jgi:hypothetical protein